MGENLVIADIHNLYAHIHNLYSSTLPQSPPSLLKDVLKKIGRRSNLSDLKMMLLNMVASKLQGEHLSYYTALPETFYTDGSGVLPADEFKRMSNAPNGPVENKRADPIRHCENTGKK